MSKTLKSNNLFERPANRTLLAVSLCAIMAAFGCTTDRNVGNGDPVVTPGLRTSPTGNLGGSETAPMPPPMMSSYSGEALPTVQRRVARVSAAEAAAIMAEHQPRVRYLGPGAPGAPNRPYVSDGRTNQFTNPASYYGNRSTVNSSLTSGPTAVVSSGAGEAIGGSVDASALVAPSIDSGTNVTAASTAGGSAVIGTAGGTTAVTSPNTLATVTPSATAVSPTASAVAAPSGMAATRTLSPTAAAVVNPPASVSAVATATPAATRATAARQTTATASPTVTASNAGAVASQVRVVTDANGRVTVTNRQQ
jgi:hypothetical protein